MDSPQREHRPDVLDSETERERVGDGADRGGDPDRDLRDVLSRLVVDDGDRETLSVAAIASAAGGSERLVPELLAALESDATAVRIGAAWALCALADDRPAAAGYLAERVGERMADGDEPFEVGQVLAYLRGRYPGRVADALDVAAAQDSLGEPADDRRRNGLNESGRDGRTNHTEEPARADGQHDGKRIETDGGVPAAAVTDLGDGRQVVRPDGGSGAVHERTASPAEPTRAGDAPAEPTPPGGAPTEPTRSPESASHPTEPNFEGSRRSGGDIAATDPDGDTVPKKTATGTGGVGPAKPADPTGPPVPEREHRPETPETFASIAALSSFDRLSAVDRGVESRYARGYRCRAVTEEDERGVATRLFDRPDEGDRLDFRADLADALARWATLGDGEHVVAVEEWGERPRPWAAVRPVDASLADRGRPSLDDALDRAVALAEAVDHCHRNGLVHGGIDPENVVYPGDGLAGLDRPLLDNPGLMATFREYFEPADYLDPRFAAPEYFDDEFGSVDAATDVYGLGAVCYFLLTGRPPFDGSYSDVRRGVLSERPTAPSAVRDAVPEDADAVVTKALAKRKLKRYDSVAALAADLRRVRDCDG